MIENLWKIGGYGFVALLVVAWLYFPFAVMDRLADEHAEKIRPDSLTAGILLGWALAPWFFYLSIYHHP